MTMANAVREFTTEINFKGNVEAIIAVNVDNNTFDCCRSFRSMSDRELTVYNYEEWRKGHTIDSFGDKVVPPIFWDICSKIRELNA